MVVRDARPGGGSTQFKQNGYMHSSKQQHQCKSTTISGGLTHYLCSTMVRLSIEVGQETLLGLRSAVRGGKNYAT